MDADHRASALGTACFRTNEGRQVSAETTVPKSCGVAGHDHCKDTCRTGRRDPCCVDCLRARAEAAEQEIERLTEIAEQHEVELAFWKPGLAAWRLVTAPTPADLEALTDAVLIVETPLAIDVARNVLKAIADRARAPEHEPARSTEGT
jgi:hypothetical protein